MSKDPPEGDGDRGYGKPSKEHQFKPGNRAGGRKPGSKNKPRKGALTDLEQMFLDEGRRIVQPDTGLTASRAVIRAHIKTAVKGGSNAQDAYLRRTTAIEEKAQRWRDDLLVRFEVSLRRSAEHLANTDPATREKLEARLLPHPDDVEVDLAAGTILIRGPATWLE